MTSVVYFVKSLTTGAIKIGTSSNLARRVAALNGAVPGGCELLASVPGDAVLEAHLHSVLAEFRVSGEWFEPHAEVLAVVERYRTHGAKAVPTGFGPSERSERVSLAELHQIVVDEMKVMIRACAEPTVEGDTSALQVERAARRAGLSPKRAKSYWYGEVGSVPAEEYFHVARIALRHATNPETAVKITSIVGGLITEFAAAATRFAKLYGREPALGALGRPVATDEGE